MYSSKIIQRNIEAFEAKSGVKLVRWDISRVREWVEHLDARKKKADDEKRPLQLTKEEREFIRNELVMAVFDYLYHAERYHFLLLDGGGLGLFNSWGSQAIMLEHMRRIEEEMYEALDAGLPVDGILMAWHKARQLGASLLAQSLLAHRATTTPHNRCLVASVEDLKTVTLFTRFERILEHLPWWFVPKITDQVKSRHLIFGELDSSILLQDSKQMSGIGQGEQFEVSHLTEVASWAYPDEIEHNFFPTIPQSVRALSILESTAQGRGNWWHQFCTSLESGFTRRWKFVFVPWYAEPKKYRAAVPVDWTPTTVAKLHARMVEDTSPRYCFGKRVTLTQEQLYWWESTRDEYQRNGTLNIFLTNFCSTPEESFQHTGVSPFQTELLEKLRGKTSVPVARELRRVEAS